MPCEISSLVLGSTNFSTERTIATQTTGREIASVEIQASPPIVVNIPSDSIAVVVLGLACLLVWMAK